MLFMKSFYPPLAEQRCGTCRYAQWIDGSRLNCRRYAPRPDGANGTLAMWPAVLENYFCGEWSPRDDG